MRPASTSRRPFSLSTLALLIVPSTLAQNLPIAQQCALVAQLTKVVTIPTDVNACCTYRHNLTQPADAGELAIVCDTNFATITELFFGNLNIGAQFGGAIPWETLSQLRDLDVIRFENNSFTGEVGWSNFSMLPKLATLDLSKNSLTGTVDISNLTRLTNLHLSYNQFSGPMPDISIAQSMTNVDISFNPNLTGNFPNITANQNLALVNLANTNVGGPFPSLNHKNIFYLYCNNCNVSGPIPPVVNAPRLQTLAFGYNSISGTLPSLTVTGLQNIFLENNTLTGMLPDLTVVYKSIKAAGGVINLNYNCGLTGFGNLAPADFNGVVYDETDIYAPRCWPILGTPPTSTLSDPAGGGATPTSNSTASGGAGSGSNATSGSGSPSSSSIPTWIYVVVGLACVVLLVGIFLAVYVFFIRKKPVPLPPPAHLPDTSATLSMFPPQPHFDPTTQMPRYEPQFQPPLAASTPIAVGAPTQLAHSYHTQLAMGVGAAAGVAPAPGAAVVPSSMASVISGGMVVNPPESAVTYDSNDPNRPLSHVFFDVPAPNPSEPAPP
ncbi:hypothetical protein HK101_008489, partial [Irineochytrium annulatum]